MRFIEQAIARAGLMPVLTARRAGDVDAVRSALSQWKTADLLVLGAMADVLRDEEVGPTVTIHRAAPSNALSDGVVWVDAPGGSDLEVLRSVAVTRIAAAPRARIGVDWGRHGLEIAQVALGFGASDLRGPIQKKSGLPILEDEAKKVKGQGMVALASIRKQEIAALVTHAGRVPVFADESAPVEAAVHA